MDHEVAVRPSDGRRRPGREHALRPRLPEASGPVYDITALQKAAGNQAVSRMLHVQRCGSVPSDRCGCHSAEEAPVVQRHVGFQTKGALEFGLLRTTELQTAASAADRALEESKSRGDAVRRLEEGLSAAGSGTALSRRPRPTSTYEYDAYTRAAVAHFQTAHDIPFPTGRQAGPKTLSTLDNHLLGKSAPPPRPICDTYAPGEREASLVTPGTATRSGAFGQELRLANFGAGRGRMKPEHERAVRELISAFELFDPKAGFEVEFIRGFTDSVDREESNALLREERAVDVEFFVKQSGVPGAPQGAAAAEGSYDTGCDPRGRAAARAVLIRLRKRQPPLPNCALPHHLGTGRGCAADADFAHHDFPSISAESTSKLAVWAIAHSNRSPFRQVVASSECEIEMDSVLTTLAGSDGHAAFARFAAGTGGKATHGPGSSLGTQAIKSASFAATVAAIKTEIEAQLIAQAATGTLDPCALSVPNPPQTEFLPTDSAALKAVIGGTQGESISLLRFEGDAAKRTYSLDLRIVICDDFGVDESDLYAPGLMAFWVLQHERRPDRYVPFVNELDLHVTIGGAF